MSLPARFQRARHPHRVLGRWIRVQPTPLPYICSKKQYLADLIQRRKQMLEDRDIERGVKKILANLWLPQKYPDPYVYRYYRLLIFTQYPTWGTTNGTTGIYYSN